jgi:pimeloyl-ACP methyl ester carboxylesterase
MPAVFVHGVPETPQIWDPLRAKLGRSDVLTPRLPGFGSDRPAGFGATKDEYVAWLIGELETVGEPVDLVGHDWGGGFVVRVVSIRPDLVRSWVSDAAAIGHADFGWHDFAKIWQTPGEGEAFWDGQLALPADERGALLAAGGVPSEHATDLAGHVDSTMTACILDLYRSATEVGQEWAPDFRAVGPPGLVLIASDDPFLSQDLARSAAETAGATTAELAGLGHWWMLQDPDRAATTLESFWASTVP